MDGPGVAISMDELEQGQRLRQYQHATPEVPRSEYHDQVVKPKLLNRPWLDILHEFLDPTTEHFAVSPDHRLLYFDIQVIHISGDGEVNPPIKCKNATEFNEAISNADSERRGTLVIAEDLSRAMIDALGMQYNLDPEFFASHLLGTQLFHTGEWQCIRDPVRAPNILPGYLRKASYYTVEFRRPYHFPGGKKTIVELRSTKTSTPRGVHILNEDIPDAFVVEKISVYKGKTFGMIYSCH